LPNPEYVIPWESNEWDDYVSSHEGATVYHTSAWCRIVTETGRYTPRFMLARRDGGVTGILPALEVRSRLTGNRLVSLPFSDVCGPLANDDESADLLLREALRQRETRRLAFYELRGTPLVAGQDPQTAEGGDPRVIGEFQRQEHFYGYEVPLSGDTEAVRMTFSKKSIRQSISKSLKLGVEVRRGEGAADLRLFYNLYALNRKRHGIPPQPLRLFNRIFEVMRGSPEASLYIAQFEGQCAAALIVFRFRGVAYAKYEGVDETYRRVLPVNPMIWQSIQDACAAGDRFFDFGRTAADNRGLNDFKGRWGTQQRTLPYFFNPPSEGLSVVKSDSLKYRLFTGVFRRMPLGLSIRIGDKIFRHFG